MFIIANFIYAVARILDMILSAYSFLIIIQALISWVNPDPFNPFVQFLRTLTEPVYSRMRRFIPPIGPLDLTPFVVLLAIFFMQNFLVRSLIDLSMTIR